MWTLAESIAAVGGERFDPNGESAADPISYCGVTTDSRAECSGRLFIALVGDRYDGHDHVAAAAAAGAVAALVSCRVAVDIPQWLVADTRLALGQLAAAWRLRLDATVVAITGSNGKTTCKTLLAAVLSQVGKTHATQGNLNNDIGLPLTILSARDERFLVLELGANHPGEIAYLTNIARPDVAIITGVGRAHLEGFGSVAGVAQAKGEIAQGLAADGTFIYPANSPFATHWQPLAGDRRRVTFGLLPSADVHLNGEAPVPQWDESGLQMTFDVGFDAAVFPPLEAGFSIHLPLAGAHHVSNALAVISAAVALGIPAAAIQTGLANVAPIARRLQPKRSPSGLRLLDDSYNANPDSLAAAIAVLIELAPPGQAVLILGDCGELGRDALALHSDMGRQAQLAGVARLYAVGQLAAAAVTAFGNQGVVYSDHATLLTALRHKFNSDHIILIKGSRRAAMDRIVDVMETW
ncbi:UDP-N-acetylmuramoyl-tripeptide--D-alanyl-D-alanine ligase [Thiospirillum jenense]|uniref:UDP-N-acetylmuramoyl-tripeptide--D-alanyl-D-alanine ligase n=2 Tax=Thiospirillum jenense TaxID=1653858 RepID=A0A839HG98_9GAMM|nr:UDP-N-acetylmuramoyl-tripeptide--D-alanyl-D-alanine ligase [Thiospirillum jenense]